MQKSQLIRMNKEFEFRDLKKGERRGLGVIYLLINEDLPQKDILKDIEKVIGEKIDTKTLSNVLRDLEIKEIIKKEPFKEKGKRGYQNLISIPKNHYTLKKLICYLYLMNDVPFLLLLKGTFIYSNYPRKLIDIDLVLEIESKLGIILNRYNSIDFSFKEDERQLIIKILQNSPSALHYAIKLYENDLVEIMDFKKLTKNLSFVDFQKELKEHFIFKLQTYLGEDISKIGSYTPIEYTTSAIFLPIKKEELTKYNKGVFISQEIERSKIKRTIIARKRMKAP